MAMDGITPPKRVEDCFTMLEPNTAPDEMLMAAAALSSQLDSMPKMMSGEDGEAVDAKNLCFAARNAANRVDGSVLAQVHAIACLERETTVNINCGTPDALGEVNRS
jgi:hypothetical protein